MTDKENPFTAVENDAPAKVTGIHDNIEHFGSADTRRATIEPKVFRIGDDPEPFTAYEPDAGTVMDIEEAQTSRRVLALFLGDEWGRAEAAIEGLQPDTLVDMAQSLSRHFKLYSGGVEGNRAARRRAGRNSR